MYQRDGCAAVMAGYDGPQVVDRHYDEYRARFQIEFEMPDGVSKNRVEVGILTFAPAFIRQGSKKVISVEYFKPLPRPVYVSIYGADIREMLEFAYQLYSWGQSIASEKGVRWLGPLVVFMKSDDDHTKRLSEGVRRPEGGWDWTVHNN